MAFLPVNSLQTDKGALATLVPRFGEEKSMPIELESSDTNLYKNFRVIQDDISVSLASNLKIGNIFGGSVEYNSRAFYFDAVAYTDKYRERQLGNSVISATRWGVGLRILLHISKFSSDLDFSFSQITAAVQLGKAKARYEILGLGIGIDGLTTVLDNISPVADFGFETYKSITDKIIPKLSNYIKNNKDKLEPQPIAVELIEPLETDSLVYGQSVAFAVRKLSKRYSLSNVLHQAGGEFDEEVIRRVYFEMTESDSVVNEPPQIAVEKARDWWKEVR